MLYAITTLESLLMIPELMAKGPAAQTNREAFHAEHAAQCTAQHYAIVTPAF
jgi:hypothetical protein